MPRAALVAVLLLLFQCTALGQTIIYTFEGTLQMSPLDNDGFDGAGLVGAAVSVRIEADANASPIDIITDPTEVLFSILDAELTITGSVRGVADGTFPVLDLDSLHLINDLVRSRGMVVDGLAIGADPLLFQINRTSATTTVGGIFPGTTWDTNLSLPLDFGEGPITLDFVTFGRVGQDFYRFEDGSATVFPPAHLDILSATIEELPLIDSEDVAGRQVILRIEVAGPPPSCQAQAEFLAYGFLIDADKNRQTGVSPRAFHPLGVDARITAECDPTLGTFVNPIAMVDITTDDTTNVTTIEIPLTVDLLPSVDFHWIAFAMQGSRLIRLPGQLLSDDGRPDHAAWATFEITLF